MSEITGEYKITIKEELLPEKYYSANIELPNGHKGWTSGDSEEDILEMIADWIMVVNDIPSSKWNRFWHKLLRLK
jgi:hypothetical protein